jgi:hypothetical protein
MDDVTLALAMKSILCLYSCIAVRVSQPLEASSFAFKRIQSDVHHGREILGTRAENGRQ